MNSSYIFVFVFMVFGYIVFKHKVLPYLASRKLAKGNTAENKADTADMLSQLGALGFPAGALSLAPAPADGKPSNKVTYFDTKLIMLDGELPEEDEANISTVVNVMLLELGKRGIAPDLGFCPLTRNCLLVYAVYKL